MKSPKTSHGRIHWRNAKRAIGRVLLISAISGALIQAWPIAACAGDGDAPSRFGNTAFAGVFRGEIGAESAVLTHFGEPTTVSEKTRNRVSAFLEAQAASFGNAVVNAIAVMAGAGGIGSCADSLANESMKQAMADYYSQTVGTWNVAFEVRKSGNNLSIQCSWNYNHYWHSAIENVLYPGREQEDACFPWSQRIEPESTVGFFSDCTGKDSVSGKALSSGELVDEFHAFGKPISLRALDLKLYKNDEVAPSPNAASPKVSDRRTKIVGGSRPVGTATQASAYPASNSSQK